MMLFQARKEILKITGLGLVLILCNLHLIQDSSPASLVYRQDLVAAGEWWRIITHLFVHVSWYHLFLDAAAVCILWHEIELENPVKKVFVALFCAVGSLLTAVWFSPHVEQYGYCGLSGMAHGLMFFLGLVWLHRAFPTKGKKRFSLPLFCGGSALVTLSGIKSIMEVASGAVILSPLHFGNLGIPIVHAHLGGVVGGLSAFIILHVTHK